MPGLNELIQDVIEQTNILLDEQLSNEKLITVHESTWGYMIKICSVHAETNVRSELTDFLTKEDAYNWLCGFQFSLTLND